MAFYVQAFKEAIQDEIFLIFIKYVNWMAVKSGEKLDWLALTVDPNKKPGNVKVTCFKIVVL